MKILVNKTLTVDASSGMLFPEKSILEIPANRRPGESVLANRRPGELVLANRRWRIVAPANRRWRVVALANRRQFDLICLLAMA